MRKTVWTILALTLADAVCTATGLRIGAITEGNPLMASLMHAAPELTAVAVCAVVGALLLLLYLARGRVRWIRPALAGVVCVKLAVLGLHLGWMLQII